MNEAEGRVVRVEGAWAWVRLESRPRQCGACGQQATCGIASQADEAPGGPETGALIRLPNAIRAFPGDRVVVCAAKGQVLSAAWRAYGMPLLGGMAGAVVGMSATGGDAGAGLGMLVGLAGGFALSYRLRLESRGGEPMLTLRFKHTH